MSWSVKQDESKDLKLTVQAQRFSPVAAILCALTLTFAGFDWVMSLYPFWYSTIFGVWFFAGGFVAAHALITLVTLSLRDSGFTGKAITVEHYHDLGKLTFRLHRVLGVHQLRPVLSHLVRERSPRRPPSTITAGAMARGWS